MTSSMIASQISYGKLWFCLNLSDFGSRSTHRCCHKGLRRFFEEILEASPAKFLLFFFLFFPRTWIFRLMARVAHDRKNRSVKEKDRLLYKSVLICICIRLADNRDYTLSNRRSDYFSSFPLRL